MMASSSGGYMAEEPTHRPVNIIGIGSFMVPPFVFKNPIAPTRKRRADVLGSDDDGRHINIPHHLLVAKQNVDDPKEAAPLELRAKNNALDLKLPPISNVNDAFADLLRRILDNKDKTFPDLKQLAKNGGFTINVGTMCSGTEAPIFALKLLQAEFHALTGTELFRFNHQYSVEIEPYKQAYIRRNTDAKVFRDVRDFASPDVLSLDL